MSEAAAAANTGATFQACVTNILTGEEVGTFEMPVQATVAELKDMIASAGGPQAVQQRILHGEQTLLEDSLALKDLRQEGGSEQDIMSFGVGRLHRRNLALSSSGARLVGSEWAEGQNRAGKPLLRFDDAFPDLEGDPSGSRLGEVVSGSDLAAHLRRRDEKWKGDCDVSTFLNNRGAVTIHVPGEDNHFEKVGFTYSPWDRNYGHLCEVLLSQSADGPWNPVGCIEVPAGDERGDPSRNSAKTLYLEIPPAFARRPFSHVSLAWGSDGDGRRLFFVYAFGY